MAWTDTEIDFGCRRLTIIPDSLDPRGVAPSRLRNLKTLGPPVSDPFSLPNGMYVIVQLVVTKYDCKIDA